MPPPAVVEHPPMRVRTLGRLTDEQINSLAAQLMDPITQRLRAFWPAPTSPPTTDAGRIKAALAANRWDDADPPGAYYVFNDLSLPRMRKVFRALSRAERLHLEANLEASSNDRPRMYLGIQQTNELPAGSKAEAYWAEWSERLFHAIRGGKYKDYPDGAYWILNYLNEEGRAYVLRFLHREYLDALYDHGLDTAGIPHGKDILVKVHLERTRRRPAPTSVISELQPILKAAPRPVMTLRGDHPDLSRLAAAFRRYGVDVVIDGPLTGNRPKVSPHTVTIPEIPVPAEPSADSHNPALLVSGKEPAIEFVSGLESPKDLREAADAERRKKIDDLLLYTKYKIVAPLEGRSDSEAGRAFPNPEGDVARSVDTWRNEEAAFRERLFARGFDSIDAYRVALDTFEATFLQSASSLAYNLLRAFEERLREGEWVYSDDRAVEELIASARASSASGLEEQARLRRGEVGGSEESGQSIERVQEDAEKLRRDAEDVLRNLPGHPLVHDPLFPRMALLTASPAEVKDAINRYIRARRADTERVRTILRNDPKAVYGMPVVIDQTMSDLGIRPGTALHEILTDRRDEYGSEKKALQFLLGLFSAILGVLGGIAALAGTAISVYSGVAQTSDYLDAAALFGSGLSEEEQDFCWLVVDLLFTGLDVKQAASIAKGLRPFTKAQTLPEIERRLMRIAEDVRLGRVDRQIARTHAQEALQGRPPAQSIPHGRRIGLTAPAQATDVIAEAERIELRNAYRKLLGVMFVVSAGGPFHAVIELAELIAIIYRIGKGRAVTFTRFIREMRAAGALTTAQETAEQLQQIKPLLSQANDVIHDLQQTGRRLKLTSDEVGDVVRRWGARPSQSVDEVKTALANVAKSKRAPGGVTAVSVTGRVTKAVDTRSQGVVSVLDRIAAQLGTAASEDEVLRLRDALLSRLRLERFLQRELAEYSAAVRLQLEEAVRRLEGMSAKDALRAIATDEALTKATGLSAARARRMLELDAGLAGDHAAQLQTAILTSLRDPEWLTREAAVFGKQVEETIKLIELVDNRADLLAMVKDASTSFSTQTTLRAEAVLRRQVGIDASFAQAQASSEQAVRDLDQLKKSLDSEYTELASREEALGRHIKSRQEVIIEKGRSEPSKIAEYEAQFKVAEKKRAEIREKQPVLSRRIAEVENSQILAKYLSDPSGSRFPLVCFSGDTPVWTPDGSVPIDSIRRGDKVISFDFLSNQLVPQAVQGVLRGKTLSFHEIESGGEVMSATSQHSFWVEDDRRWTRAVDLRPGMRLRGLDGTAYPIDDIRIRSTPAEPTWNLAVDITPHYFVGPGVLVHNAPFDTKLGGPFVIYLARSSDPRFEKYIYVGQTDGVKGRLDEHVREAITALRKNVDRHGRAIVGELKEFYEFKASLRSLESVLSGLTEAGADWAEQVNINLEERIRGSAEFVMNRRDQVIKKRMAKLEEEILSDPAIKKMYCP
jgi:Pretoxin HINT domain